MAAPVIVVTPTSARVPSQVATASLAVGFRDAAMAVDVLSLGDGAAVRRLTGSPVAEIPTAGRAPGAAGIVGAAGIAAAARRDDVELALVHAGGLLTPFDAANANLRELLEAIVALELRVGVVVATTADDDALGHCALVTEAARARGLDVLGIVVVGHDGPWPDAARLEDVAGVPLLGTTPPQAHEWDADRFTDRAGAWLPLE